ncbi:MAG TPA: hypothetical protein VFV10_17035 [Gammaproteobacteria bacterium]|nr:hypothetical protein [Gammaproteobacteria bacterium]
MSLVRQSARLAIGRLAIAWLFAPLAPSVTAFAQTDSAESDERVAATHEGPEPALDESAAKERFARLDADILKEAVDRGARIGRVEIVTDDVFDPAKPKENKRLYRFANKVHVETRDSVIEDVILFHSGDMFDSRLLEESARLLRQEAGISEAVVVPTAYNADTNTVDVLVNTRDSWSLSADLKFGRSGGKNDFGFGVEEKNLLGTGQKILVSHKSNVDRDQNILGYGDDNVRGTRVRLAGQYADTSDGVRRALDVGRPFFALDTHWSLTGSLLDERRVDQMYDLGEVVDEFQHRQEQVTVSGGWSHGLVDGRTRRWLAGVTYDQNEFRPSSDVPNPLVLPEDRKLVYPWIGYSLVTDDFRAVEELNDIGRTEDVNLGLSVNARLGYSSTGFGADRDAWIFDMLGQKGWEPEPGKLVFVDFAASSRFEDGRSENTIVSAGARYYRRNFGNKLFFVSLSGTTTNALDLDRQVLVGGDSGLRGYPLRYQSGTARAVLTFEERVFTDWYPWKLVRVGYAAFFDSGRTWGRDPRGTESLGTLHDIGVGLRLSSPRASSGTVVHIDLAFPLNRNGSIQSAQLNIETKGSF